MNVALYLREHQEADPNLGHFFKALHTFADRTIEEFFGDCEEMGSPVISLDNDRKTNKGWYKVKDGAMLAHRININPSSHKSGADVAETLAHELVHLWQAVIGEPTRKNNHTIAFHDRMRNYGIVTEGRIGRHIGYEPRWEEWLEANADLRLDDFVLPGVDEKPRRQLRKFQCPSCDTSVRSRRALNMLCLDCELQLREVPTRNRS